jgi:spore coat polysaccharide biosynthesis protein SpsF (cytidylyltransferase family)
MKNISAVLFFPPKKKLLFSNLVNKEVILWQIERLQYSKWINDITIVSHGYNHDQEMIALANRYGINLHKRICKEIYRELLAIGWQNQSKFLIIIKGIKPLIDYEIIDMMVELCIEKECDFVRTPTDYLPEGLSCEVISFQSLQKIPKDNSNFNYSELPTSFFSNRPDIFEEEVILPVPYHHNLDLLNWVFPGVHFCIENESDLDFMQSFLRLYQSETNMLPQEASNQTIINFLYNKLLTHEIEFIG